MYMYIPPPRSQPESVPWPYAYQLSCAGDEAFQLASCQFAITGSEEYNWNFLDQHICGYPDFEELGEVSYWRVHIRIYQGLIQRG